MADRADAADGLAGPGPDRARVRPRHGADAGQRGHLGHLHAVGAAGHDEQRRPVRAEHEAVRDRAHLAAELRGRARGRRRAFRQLPHLAAHAELAQRGREPGEVNWHAKQASGVGAAPANRLRPRQWESEAENPTCSADLATWPR